MKKVLLFTTIWLGFQTFSFAQTPTFERVYQIFQTNCASPYCHGNSGQNGGLDLEGAGATTADKMTAVYNNLVGVIPSNTEAAAKNDHIIYKGRADKSFLFRKVNNGLESTVSLATNEGDAMPKGGTSLTSVEKELIRQWILFGAPATGEVVKESLLVDYYENGLGANSFPVVPAAPAASEGFQIKMGPFFLAPQNNAQGWLDEVEYFQKWKVGLPNDVEVTRIDTKMGTYSHHFIMYDYDNPAAANNLSDGLRTNISHVNISLVEAIQEPTDLRLPQGSAFFWENDIVLDLNSHYINYDANKVHKAEAYINIYTQPTGTANQEMYTILEANPSIYIPNNGNAYTFSQTLNYNLGTVYLWSMMGHTHQWGAGYKVYKRTNQTKGALIYDAACPQGIPGCATPFFDYQHIPMRFYDPLLPINFNFANGVIHEASYINTGTAAVGWGDTSDDEMMVVVFMGLTDTTGVTTNIPKITANPLDDVKISPNPATDRVFVSVPPAVTSYSFTLVDILGSIVMHLPTVTGNQIAIEKEGLPAGVYIYKIETENGRHKTGKIVFK